MDGLHAGHRKRMRDRFRSTSLDAFEDHEKLELLLSYAIPRRDLNPLAHRLIDRFGSLAAVIDAPEEVVREIEGMGEQAALFLRLLRELWPIYSAQRQTPRRTVARPLDAARELFQLYRSIRPEAVSILALSGEMQLLYAGQVCDGNASFVGAGLREVSRVALAYGCIGMVLGHNHPSGQLEASPQDISGTALLESALTSLGVDLIDHVIIGEKGYLSFAERQMMPQQSRGWRRKLLVGMGSEIRYRLEL